MNTEQLIEKHLFGKKPKNWDDEFDRIQHLSVNDVRALLDEHAKCVLSDVSVSLLEEAANLVGNPGTNISGSCDIACVEWQEKYERWRNER